MRCLSVRQRIVGDPVRVIEAIWSGAEWNKRWNAIKEFSVHYDDGLHQVSEIKLDWFGAEVQMEVVRFRIHPFRIEFFCPRPPHPLAYQSGSWSVEREGKGTFLVAARRIALVERPLETQSEVEERITNYAKKLSMRLSAVLTHFVE